MLYVHGTPSGGFALVLFPLQLSVSLKNLSYFVAFLDTVRCFVHGRHVLIRARRHAAQGTVHQVKKREDVVVLYFLLLTLALTLSSSLSYFNYSDTMRWSPTRRRSVPLRRPAAQHVRIVDDADRGMLPRVHCVSRRRVFESNCAVCVRVLLCGILLADHCDEVARAIAGHAD